MMDLPLASLLVNEPDLPEDARRAVSTALHASAVERPSAIKDAARALMRSTSLDCGEVKDLFGLPRA